MANDTTGIDKTLEWEGRNVFTNDPDDPGGGTMSGITTAEARSYGYTGPMKDLPLTTATAIYKQNYWDKFNLDAVESQGIANQILQAAVNQGVERWQVYIQNICNQFLTQVEELVVDGIIGALTIAAINTITDSGLTAELSLAIYTRQEDRYDEVVEKNPVLEKYRKGWHNRSSDFLIVKAA